MKPTKQTPEELYGNNITYPPDKIPTLKRNLIPEFVNLNVPYIHQLWDTPNDFHGGWACGPACVAMVLAYYNLIKPNSIRVNVPTVHESDYGWYVSTPFEAREGHWFRKLAPTKTGRAAGLYGSIVDEIGNGYGAHIFESRGGRGIIPTFKRFTDRKVIFKAWPKIRGSRFMPKTITTDYIKLAISKGSPVIVSGFFNGKYDHLIVVRGYFNCGKETKFIVNDPYGFGTDKSYDGGNVVYGFEQINPKYLLYLE